MGKHSLSNILSNLCHCVHISRPLQLCSLQGTFSCNHDCKNEIQMVKLSKSSVYPFSPLFFVHTQLYLSKTN